tara:strand:- start:1038 stop:1520 length:483 start_codon:yes stop_codon:yes gene_type:complete
MGYTNYWYRLANENGLGVFSDQQWVFLTDIARRYQRVMDHPEHGLPLLGGIDGQNKPTINDKMIAFNGFVDLVHEPFILYKSIHHRLEEDYLLSGQPDWRQTMSPPWPEGSQEYFIFCKTNQKPYDEAVWHILVNAQHMAPNHFRIANDDGIEIGSFHDK